MRIGVDISQLAYPATGVSNYLFSLVSQVIKNDKKNEYVLFFSSMRKKLPKEFEDNFKGENVTIKKVKIPLTMLNYMWNVLHVFKIEKFIGKIDLLITSDWLEPPSSAQKNTIIYDLVTLRYPNETAQQIVSTQKRKLFWVKKESKMIFCISKSTKKDIIDLLGINKNKIKVIYPGL